VIVTRFTSMNFRGYEKRGAEQKYITDKQFDNIYISRVSFPEGKGDGGLTVGRGFCLINT